MYNESIFLKSISDSFAKYKEHGARSPKKLIPIHKFVAELLKRIWGTGYDCCFMGEDTKEATVEGKYYPKDIDITIKKGEEVVFCVGIKFITSNYKQNANNYFEGMMGETANIQANKIPYVHLIIMRYETPYYTKNNSTVSSKTEIINEKDIRKYLKLVYDEQQAHRPKCLCVFLVDIDEGTGNVTKTPAKKVFSDEKFADLIQDGLSPENFFKQIADYKEDLETSRN